MEPADEQELREHRIDIVEVLEPDDVIHNLYEDGIISEGEISTLCSGSTRTRKERCRALLDILPRRGPKAFHSFLFALHESGNSSLAVKLRMDLDRGYGIDNRTRNKPCDTCKPYLPHISRTRSEFGGLLVQKCCLLLQIDPVDCLDDFYQEGLFGENECQLIRASITRLDRCKSFYHELCQRKSNKIISVFQKALERQRKYHFIYKAFQESVESKIDNSGKFVSADKINSYLEKDECMVCKDSSDERIKKETKFNRNEVNNHIQRKRRHHQSEEDFHRTRVNENFVVHERHGVNNDQKSTIFVPEHTNRNAFCPVFLNPLSLSIEAVENKHKQHIYHKLSRLITNGLFDEYQKYFSKMCCKYKENPDIYSMLVYVNSSRHAFVYQYTEAKTNIKIALSMTNSRDVLNPCSLQVELLAALARIYVSRKKFSKLEHVLDQAKMIVKSDPNRCKGVASGWLFFNNARYLLAKMAICSFRRVKTYNWLKDQVLDSLNTAVANFVEDLGDDGLFGIGCCFCLIAITLLCCGENGMAMEVDLLKPCQPDIELAGQLLSRVDGDKIPVPYALKALLMLARCDYLYRKNEYHQAIKCACEVQAIAESCHMTEFVEQATVRLEKLVQKVENRKRCIHQGQFEEEEQWFADISGNEKSND